MKTKEKDKILCVSQADIFRGPVMAGYFNQAFESLKLNLVAESAGLTAINGLLIHDQAKKISELDLSGHRSRAIDLLDIKQYKTIYCTDEWVRNQLIDFGAKQEDVIALNKEYKGITIPTDDHSYGACAETIKAEVLEVIDYYFENAVGVK